MKRKLNLINWLALFLVIFLLGSLDVRAQNSNLNQYVGQYQLGQGIVIITLENGKLMVQVTGDPTKTELIAESETDFVLKGQPVKVTFSKDANNQVTGLIVIQGGNKIPAQKLSSETAAPVKPIDKSPHKSEFITANAIKMNYLDWGGTGEVVLLLSGFGNDAHIFDEFATKFTDKFHVIGLTRRGFGETDKPKNGYDTKTRVEDIYKFLDALKIKKAHIIGHSLAGDEMTLFAGIHPKQIGKLVYLDAAYDRSKNFECNKEIPGIPLLYKRLFREVSDCPNASEIVVENMLPPDIWNVYVSTLKGSLTLKLDYKKVKSPALSFYDVAENNPQITPQTDEETRKKMQAWWQEVMVPRNQASREQFRKELKRGKVVEMKNAGHYLFMGKTADEVILQTREFLLGFQK